MRFSDFIKTIAVLAVLSGGTGISFANPPSELKSNGMTWVSHSSGIRIYNFVDVYQCTLYLNIKNKPSKDELISAVNHLTFPIALHIKVLTSMLPDKMPETWRETIESEITGKAFHKFQKGFSRLDEGDVLLFVYSPKEETRLLLNGKLMFKDPGPGLMQSLLEQWIGPKPISEELKQALVRE